MEEVEESGVPLEGLDVDLRPIPAGAHPGATRPSSPEGRGDREGGGPDLLPHADLLLNPDPFVEDFPVSQEEVEQWERLESQPSQPTQEEQAALFEMGRRGEHAPGNQQEQQPLSRRRIKDPLGWTASVELVLPGPRPRCSTSILDHAWFQRPDNFWNEARVPKGARAAVLEEHSLMVQSLPNRDVVVGGEPKTPQPPPVARPRAPWEADSPARERPRRLFAWGTRHSNPSAGCPPEPDKQRRARLATRILNLLEADMPAATKARFENWLRLKGISEADLMAAAEEGNDQRSGGGHEDFQAQRLFAVQKEGKALAQKGLESFCSSGWKADAVNAGSSPALPRKRDAASSSRHRGEVELPGGGAPHGVTRRCESAHSGENPACHRCCAATRSRSHSRRSWGCSARQQGGHAWRTHGRSYLDQTKRRGLGRNSFEEERWSAELRYNRGERGGLGEL